LQSNPKIAKMMILFRRRFLSLTALFLILLLIYLHSRPYSSPSYSPIIEAEKPHGPIDWSKVKTRYPAKNITPLPKAANGALPKLQATFPAETDDARRERLSRLEAVKSNFTHAWTGYRTHAWLADEVAPISGNKINAFGGWGATLVDALGKFILFIARMQIYSADTS
jgi:mannosyl-oligosaccharide alpha-1,2-mannosidase